jgi:alpha-glucosidase (family GH31 glycosyl hydrolase)
MVGATLTNILRTWDNLENTVSMALSLAMYGISNIVVDICGTGGAKDDELCVRWMQLAAFMPMARNFYT